MMACLRQLTLDFLPSFRPKAYLHLLLIVCGEDVAESVYWTLGPVEASSSWKLILNNDFLLHNRSEHKNKAIKPLHI